MSDYIEQIKISISETVFHSSTSYSYFGNESARLSPRVKRVMTPRTARNYLLYQLQSHLYSDFYIRGGASPSVWGNPVNEADGVSFVETLSAANEGSGCRESGWKILTEVKGRLSVRKGGLELWVRTEDYSLPEGQSTKPGTSIMLRMPKELPGISPGYYMALSNQQDIFDEAQPLVRLYWNLHAEGGPIFVRCATRALNESGLFFRLKVLNDPRAYSRCDAAVVYFRKSQHSAIMANLARVYLEVANYLKPKMPMFTKAIAPGVGLAEDPGKDESFGQHRCRILADGMISAYEHGAQSLSERFEIVTKCYASAGIWLNQPYLNPNSTDVYAPFQSRMT